MKSSIAALIAIAVIAAASNWWAGYNHPTCIGAFRTTHVSIETPIGECGVVEYGMAPWFGKTNLRQTHIRLGSLGSVHYYRLQSYLLIAGVTLFGLPYTLVAAKRRSQTG
jgi:hypothetical protein